MGKIFANHISDEELIKTSSRSDLPAVHTCVHQLPHTRGAAGQCPDRGKKGHLRWCVSFVWLLQGYGKLAVLKPHTFIILWFGGGQESKVGAPGCLSWLDVGLLISAQIMISGS